MTGVLEAIDMGGYRNEMKATMDIAPSDADAEIDPVPTSGDGRKPEPELDKIDLYGQFVENDSFKKSLTAAIFRATYKTEAAASRGRSFR